MDQKDLDKIQNQAKLWNLYSIGSPLLLIIFVLVLYIIDALHYDFLFWVCLFVFGLSSVIWWVWAVTTIIKLTNTLKQADENFLIILKEIQSLKIKIIDDSVWKR